SRLLLGFRSAVDDPWLRPAPVVLAWIGSDLRRFYGRCAELGVPGSVAGTFAARLLDYLREVDALPQDDPFWERTNRRPTLLRMDSWAYHRLAAAPADPAALTMAAACEVVYRHVFWPPTWVALLGTGVWDAWWAVYAALNGYDGGYDTEADLAELLRRAVAPGTALSALGRLKQSPAAWVAEWSERVRGTNFVAEVL
ncbi:MAG: hypothetical protein JWM47_4412, partial [Acidimicrobiales bacterium]|nr:hypothetical protein [Acidimicrobiales bacterium]